MSGRHSKIARIECAWSPCAETFPLRIALRRHQKKCPHRPTFVEPAALFSSTTPTPLGRGDDETGVILLTPPPTPPTPKAVQNLRQATRTPPALRKTAKPLTNFCKYCGKGFTNRHLCSRHGRQNCPNNPHRELPTNTCPHCHKTVNGSDAALKYHTLLNHTVIDINKLSESDMKLLHPFHTNDLNPLRSVDPVLPHQMNSSQIRGNWIKRLDLYCTAVVKRSTKPCSVYLVATIGQQFESAGDAYNYIMRGGENVSFYLGCNGNGIDVHPHHFRDPDNSCLGQAAQSGKTVVLLKLWPFQGLTRKVNLENAHQFEAKLIEYALTGQKYTATDGSRLRWLNVRREAATFITLPIKQQEKAITDGLTGVPFLCRNAKCDGKCPSFLHLRKEDCKVLPFPTPTNVTVVEQTSLPSPKKRLTDPQKIKEGINIRLKKIQIVANLYNQRNTCVYISLLPLVEEYNEISPTDFCQNLDATPGVDKTTDCYIGKNNHDSGMHNAHTKTPHLTTPGQVLLDGSRKCVQVCKIPRVNVEEAENLEARLLVHLFLQARVRCQGRKLKPFNKNLSPAAWLRCSMEEKEECVAMGLAGVSPISFGTDKRYMKLKGINYPIVMDMAVVKEVALPDEEEEDEY
ncbi:uncharacterized protein LOC110842478 isoform X2 [Folsomia candida]|uniref:uncharacterized protein LOC110842478 isoform X2 n=1 Tax=Folsomia candida TaxID=158441 RepID=UPI0016051FCE|nr:uncharacterized protein LOC110842478 isoform X2 [Folsomia candida]